MRVIFDTHVWISFLIGKCLSIIRKYVADRRIIIITTAQLLEEIREVTARPKLRKYFPEESVADLLQLLEAIAIRVEIQPAYFNSRDLKDNFLLDLSITAKADYLVTGDKDLLVIHPFYSISIVSPAQFEKILLSNE